MLRFHKIAVKRDYDADLCSSMYSPEKDDMGSEIPIHTVFDKNDKQAKMEKATIGIGDFSRLWLNLEAGRYFQINAKSEQYKNISSNDTSEQNLKGQKYKQSKGN